METLFIMRRRYIYIIYIYIYHKNAHFFAIFAPF